MYYKSCDFDFTTKLKNVILYYKSCMVMYVYVYISQQLSSSYDVCVELRVVTDKLYS